MITMFKYSQKKGIDEVSISLEFSKAHASLSPELYAELTALAEKVKAQFNEETE